MIDLQDGTIMLIDKPLGWTSFDVVNKIRWQLKHSLGLKKIKVGHAGTLDPLATGLLVLCVGKATKKIPELTLDKKTYTGTFLLGKTTPCYDLEQDFNPENYPINHITQASIQQIGESFLGKQLQYPPIFSAKQINGKRAYTIARSGNTVDIKPNEIEIFSFTLNPKRFPEIDFSICCSKGTYIRSIANDFGVKLHSGATLIALRRIASGNMHINQAQSIEDSIQWIKQHANNSLS